MYGQKIFDQGVHDQDVLVDEMHFPEYGKMQISPKLDLYSTKQDQVQNQLSLLRRNTRFLGRKARGSAVVPTNQIRLCARTNKTLQKLNSLNYASFLKYSILNQN